MILRPRPVAMLTYCPLPFFHFTAKQGGARALGPATMQWLHTAMRVWHTKVMQMLAIGHCLTALLLFSLLSNF